MKEVNLNLDIPSNIQRVRIDVGMCATSPHGGLWFSKYENMAVIGVEPNPYNYARVYDGDFDVADYKIVANENVVKLNREVLCNYADKGNYFKGFELAIDNVTEPCEKTFYCTSELNTGCSSLHKPIDGAPGLNGVTTDREVTVSAVSLKMILDNFPWEQIPVIEFLKTDTQANDLNVVKSCGDYLKRICFVHSEYYAHSAYEGETDMEESFNKFDSFMRENNFKCYYRSGTDVSYVNSDLIGYIITNNVVNDILEFPNGYNYL
jgi:hypothetical protein